MWAERVLQLIPLRWGVWAQAARSRRGCGFSVERPSGLMHQFPRLGKWEMLHCNAPIPPIPATARTELEGKQYSGSQAIPFQLGSVLIFKALPILGPGREQTG